MILYERFPIVSTVIIFGPVLIVLSIATRILVTSTSSPMIVGAWIASAIVGFVLVVAIPIYLQLFLSLRKRVLALTTANLWYKGITLQWGEISNISVQRHVGQPFVALTLGEPSAFLQAVPNYVSRFYYERFKRTRGSILIPAARGLSTEQLSTLIQRYWNDNSLIARQPNAPVERFDLPTTSETAAVLASGFLGGCIFLQWPALLDFIRNDNITGVLIRLLYAFVVAIAAYVVTLVALNLARKADPTFDLWQKVAALHGLALCGLKRLKR